MSNNPRHILFIARRFPPSVGGMERFAYDLSSALSESATLKKITWGGSNKWLPLVLPSFFVRGFFTLLFDPKISVIHMQDALQAPIGWLLHIIFRKPYLVVAHGLDITFNNKLYQTIILPFVRRADAVIAISSATKDEAKVRGVAAAKLQVITLGTHDDYTVIKADHLLLSKQINYDISHKKLLLATGRLVKRKGVAWFIAHVLPILVKEDPSVLYLVAGDGTQRGAINDAVMKASMANHVLMLGRVSEETKKLLYQTSDIFVMPNIVVPGDMEGFGIVAHEAATAAIPVVASNLEGIADAIKQRKNGILVESGNVGQFVEAIQKLLKSGDERRAFGQAARRFTLQQYGWQKIAKKYQQVYENIGK